MKGEMGCGDDGGNVENRKQENSLSSLGDDWTDPGVGVAQDG